MPLEITPVRNPADLEDFINLPFSLYSAADPWTPPIKKQEAELLTPGRHPFWNNARRELFLARRDGRAIGRIAAIIDAKYNDYAHERAGTFGFFECSSDQDAASALLDTSASWLREQSMNFMRGPFNPSANYSCGMLARGFGENPAIMMPWNPPEYPRMLENWGMRKEQDLFAYVIDRSSLNLPDWLRKEIERLKSEARFTYRAATKKTLANDIRAMLRIYQLAWADNWGFSPLSDAEADKHVAELKSILDPDFFALFFKGDEPVAGMVALPDMNPLLRRLGGSLGLAAPWHFWRSRKDIRRGLRIMLFGILPEYRLYGLPLLLLDHMLEKARSKPGLEWVEGSWILESNHAMNDLMEDFSGRLSKIYRIYRRDIGPC